MSNGETPNNNNENSTEGSSNNGWSDFPPFKSGEKPIQDTSEKPQEQTESEKYYEFKGAEYINVDKIDITTDQGKYKWLYSCIDNADVGLEDDLDNIIREEGVDDMDTKDQEKYLKYNDAYQDAKRSLEITKRQRKLVENLDIDGDNGVLGALERKMKALSKTMVDHKASYESQKVAFDDLQAVSSLHSILLDEMARRDPEYFGQKEIEATLESDVRDAERRVGQTMTDGYFGEDGFVHAAPNGEKMPSAATEYAKIDLECAKQDAETFNLIMDGYQAEHDHIIVPRAIKKTDFAPSVGSFIEDHTTQINQLLVESKSLVKGTPEYAANEAKRKQLARERSSARRLSARFFSATRA